MDINLTIKIFGLAVAALTSAFGTWKILSDMMRTKKDALREEYKFAKEFLGTIESGDTNPYLAQLGYLALSGDTTARHEEIKHVLSMNNPRTCMRDYLVGKSYIEYYATASPSGFVFKKCYRSEAVRKLLRWWYLLSYFFTYTLATAPILLVSFKLISPGAGFSFFIFTAITFFPLAYLALKGKTKLKGAESLINAQG